MMNRNSLQYSFLSGKALWRDVGKNILAKPCSLDKFDSAKVSKSCKTFLDSSQKAKLQWNFERKLLKFESKYLV